MNAILTKQTYVLLSVIDGVSIGDASGLTQKLKNFDTEGLYTFGPQPVASLLQECVDDGLVTAGREFKLTEIGRSLVSG